MNKYEFTCRYCNYIWEISYHPKEQPYCVKCGDRNIKAVEIASQRIDYYAGSPAFETKKEDGPDKWNF